MWYWQEQDVRTEFGPMRVVIQGERRLPAILTYHDIGLNSEHSIYLLKILTVLMSVVINLI